MAREIDRLGDDYITAEDNGATTADIDFIAEHTSHVVGRSERRGIGGDPPPDTARVVFGAIRAAFEALEGEPGLAERRAGVIGLGKVGGHLAGLLVQVGASVIGFDPSTAAQDGCRDGVELAASDEAVLATELDVLAPCALGGMIDAEGVQRLRCRVVCGAANNPLTGPETVVALGRRGILYVPDFLANYGGLIHADAERRGDASGERLELSLAERRTREILAEALETDKPPTAIAEERAWSRIRSISRGAAPMLQR